MGDNQFRLKRLNQKYLKDATLSWVQLISLKTLEDLYESLVNSVPEIKFGVAFCENSGACLVRVEGTDEELKEAASKNDINLSCGHSFIILLRKTYPINVLNGIKKVSEVCTIHAATANPLIVIVAETDQGRGIFGVIDGFKPKGIEKKRRYNMAKRFPQENWLQKVEKKQLICCLRTRVI